MTVKMQASKEQLIEQMYNFKNELNTRHGTRFKIFNLETEKYKPALNVPELIKWVESNYPTARTKSRRKDDWCVRAGIMMVLYECKSEYHHLTVKVIGSVFNRDHSTMLYSVRVASDIISCEIGRGDMDVKRKLLTVSNRFSELLDSQIFNY